MIWALLAVTIMIIWAGLAFMALSDRPHFSKIPIGRIIILCTVIVGGLACASGFMLLMASKTADWAKITALATAAQAVFVGISIFFIWYELHRSNKLAKSANATKLIEISMPLNLHLLENPELGILLSQGKENYENLSEKDSSRYERRMIIRLNQLENAFQQEKAGLLDDSTYGAWRGDLRSFIKNRLPQTFWESRKCYFTPDFAICVDELMSTSDKSTNNY